MWEVDCCVSLTESLLSSPHSLLILPNLDSNVEAVLEGQADVEEY